MNDETELGATVLPPTSYKYRGHCAECGDLPTLYDTEAEAEADLHAHVPAHAPAMHVVQVPWG
jgi:hypothetical protein